MTDLTDEESQIVYFTLRQICENGRTAFQSQIAFFSFFAAANGVAVGWLLQDDNASTTNALTTNLYSVMDDDQGFFAFFFILANLIVSLVFLFRAREIRAERAEYLTLIRLLARDSFISKIMFSYPHARYQRIAVSISVAALFMLGGWTFAVAEAFGLAKPYSWLVGGGAAVSALIVFLVVVLIPLAQTSLLSFPSPDEISSDQKTKTD